MSYFWTVLFFFLNAAHAISNTTVQPTSASTTPQDDSSTTSGTSPIPKAQYSMNVTSADSCALDSTITFEAELISSNLTDPETVVPSSARFNYQWMDTAMKRVVKTVDGLRSSICVTFSSQDVTVGDYLMTVAAYMEDDPTTIVAFQTSKFSLTQQLNGLLILTQTLDYQRDPNTFSTKMPVTMTANVRDQFLQSDLSYKYLWYQDSQLLANTNQSIYKTSFLDPFNTFLKSIIFIYSRTDVQNVPAVLLGPNKNNGMSSVTVAAIAGSYYNSSTEPVNDTLTTKTAKPDNKLEKSPFVINGVFQQLVVFKDPIFECVVKRTDEDAEDRAISVDGAAWINITCSGSTPSSVCINITDLNRTLPENHTCKPNVFVNKLDHIVEVKLTSTGWHDVHFLVYNDISRYHMIESFYGYDPDSVSVSALTIPTVFGVLGIIVIAVGGVYFMRLRRKPMVEVADFDFHPSLTHSQSQGRSAFARMGNVIRSMFPQNSNRINDSRPLMYRSAGHESSLYESL